MDKKKIAIIVTFMLIVILGLGITYAWLIQTINGDKIHSIRVGNFRFSLTEENSLTLESGEFMSDDKGMNQDGFKFSVENIGVGYGSYSIYLDDDTVPTGTTRLDDKFIKYSLEINGNKYSPLELKDRKIYEGILNKDGKDNITLRVWLNKDVNGDIGGQVFKTKLRIEANQEVSNEQATTITYDYNYLVNDVFDEYYDTSVYNLCCSSNGSIINKKIYYDDNGKNYLLTFINTQGLNFGNKKTLLTSSKYTYLFEAKASEKILENIGSEQGGIYEYELDTSWKRYSKTFSTNWDITAYKAFIFYYWGKFTKNITIEIRNLQIQEGELSTSDVVKKNNTKFGELLYLKRDNYQFLGWYTDPVNGDKIDENTIVPKDKTTYYAHWKYIGEK